MDATVGGNAPETLRALPGDEARQIMWRFAGRQDLQRLLREVRAVARGPVARLVASGGRSTHEWTAEKQALLEAFDRAGITASFAEPEEGGSLDGPKNLALALIAFELAWVDAGAAISNLAQHLALAPIRERGTAEQRRRYVSAAAGAGGRPVRRGAFALTEPIPYVGVEAGILGGKVRVAEWQEGQEPLLQVDKRGRFITNMAFADFVTAAVESGDPRIKGSCLVVLEKEDPGTFDRGTPTRKLVHQLSSTRDPVFSLRVPADRIVGGYTVRDGVIVPNHGLTEVVEAVFRRTRITVSVMTSAKLLSSVEPILRYQRNRFRGGESVTPGSPRHELGLQLREDALQRLIDVWATGEASASLGFAAARVFDELDPLERRKREYFAGQGIAAGATEQKALKRLERDALYCLRESVKPDGMRNDERYQALAANDLVRFLVADAVAAVVCPASKLWNTGYGATMMREAVSLMGGYGITEDCPGFLGHKWMDAQLEALYEGPEAVQRRQLSVTMTTPVFLAQFEIWISEMRHLSARRPGTGACALASAMELWLWTLHHLQHATDADGEKLYQTSRQGVTFQLADALCWLLASRYQILDVLELEAEGPGTPGLETTLPGLVAFYSDLAHVQAARAAGEVGRISAELVNGYNRHPAWDAEGCASCYGEGDLASLEQVIPGIESTAGSYADVIPLSGLHADKAGPCVRFKGLDDFLRLRGRLDGCLTGSRLAKDRVSAALTKVAIPEELDYPAPGRP
jgi:alkylation response protein AidB-like acyl-CoA dehydrogenase